MNLNPLLLAALSARSGEDIDPTMQTLLAGMQTGSSGGPSPATQALIGQLEATNPALGMMAKYLTASQETEEEADSEEDEEAAGIREELAAAEAELAAAQQEHAATLEQAERLVRIARLLAGQAGKLREELAQARERNDTLAAALGACYLCWGEDPDCPNCRGTGRPGSVTPDRRLFSEFVWPTVRRMKVWAGQYSPGKGQAGAGDQIGKG